MLPSKITANKSRTRVSKPASQPNPIHKLQVKNSYYIVKELSKKEKEKYSTKPTIFII